jgi:cell division protein FtsI/penicillin-binding protein 2
VAVSATLAAIALAACGSAAPPKPGPTLQSFLGAWGKGDWAAMRRQVAAPPADFQQVNAAVFSSLGVKSASFTAGKLTTAKSGDTASAPVTEHFTLPEVGAWDPTTTVRLVKRKGMWHVAWSPATINPKLTTSEKLSVTRDWPTRAPILGAGGVPLTSSAQRIEVGLAGSRIKDPSAVASDLEKAGAPHAAVTQAVAAAKAHPTLFEPVFTISQARFAQLKAQPGPDNVYEVPGTSFEPSASRQPITEQLGNHLVGTVGPITAEELKSLGSPYDPSSVVGQSGLEASQERVLAGTPTTKIDIDDSGGNPIVRLQTFPGHPGKTVRTSIDPTIQHAAEAALGTSTRPDVSMVAMRASTGQVLAVVSEPVTGPDDALDGGYPPGSTFKVLTSTMLIDKGLTPSSPATCPPTITVDGETFHNAEGDGAASDLDSAFVQSCNTAFIGLATQHLSPADYVNVTNQYGLVRSAHMGVDGVFSANVPKPAGQTELAADAIGQGRVTFSPLGMAQVASAVDSGVVRAPQLVAGAPDDTAPTHKLSPALLDDLREMMLGVVTSGTAEGTGLPAGTHAKTGTAEYGPGPESTQKIDGWLMGYDGDIAFAIVTHDTGGQDGGPINGPIIAKFLDALGSGA